MKYSLLLFCLNCLFFQSLNAQKKEQIPVIHQDDTVKVYSASSYWQLKTERLADRKELSLRQGDMEMLNDIFGNTKWINERNSYSFSKGVFIEVKSADGKKHGYYLDGKKYALIKEQEYSMRSYAIPKKRRLAINHLIDYYQKEAADDNKMARYDHLPMSSLVRPLNKCMFNPRKKMVTVVFYTQTDSSTVVPIEYHIDKSKKGNIYVVRDIQLWYKLAYHGIDSEGTICIHNHSGEVFSVKEYGDNQEAVEILSKLITGWKQMSDAERMRILDELQSSART